MSTQHHYVATMQVIDTTSVTDFEPHDCRFFEIVSGPYRTVQDAEDGLTNGDEYVLKFEGCDCVALLGYHDYEVDFIEPCPAEWMPHNLDEVLADAIHRKVNP